MQVIARKTRGHSLIAPGGMNTRPVTDKIKEALFSTWQLEIVGSYFLDLFVCSGGMGIEAISRGAKKKLFCGERLQGYRYYQKEPCRLYVYGWIQDL